MKKKLTGRPKIELEAGKIILDVEKSYRATRPTYFRKAIAHSNTPGTFLPLILRFSKAAFQEIMFIFRKPESEFTQSLK